MEKPGYAIITEGFHELSVDCMNTSFSLVKHEVRIKFISANIEAEKSVLQRVF
jgi:hypothetical protein